MQRPTTVSLDTAERLLARVVASVKGEDLPKGVKKPGWGSAGLGDRSTLRLLMGGKPSWHDIKVLREVHGFECEAGWSILCAASKGGHTAAVRELIEAGADPKSEGTPLGGTPLSASSAAGHLDVVQMLLEAGVDVDKARTEDGATPLLLAAGQGHDSVVTALLKAGADPSKATGDDGASPLLMAIERGRPGTARLLIEAGADVNQARVYSGATPLIQAAGQGLRGLAEQLLEAGADPASARTDNGLNALFMAAQNGHGDLVELLLHAKEGAGPAAGAAPDRLGNEDNEDSALAAAVGQGHRNIAMVLLDHGASCEGVQDVADLHRMLRWMAEEMKEKDRLSQEKDLQMQRLVQGIPEWCAQAASVLGAR